MKKCQKAQKRAILKICFQFFKSVLKYTYNDIWYHNIWRNMIFWIFQSFFYEKGPKKAKKGQKMAILKICFQFFKSVLKYAYNDISYHNIWRNLIFRIFWSFLNEKRPKKPKKGNFENIFSIFEFSFKIRIQRYIIP